jgi:transcription elongation GreA/GreB family factor
VTGRQDSAPGSPEIDKAEILRALLDRLRSDLAAVEASQQAMQAGATHAEARSEHAKDTRATEATYVARGLAERSETLRDAIGKLASLKPEPCDPEAGAAVLTLATLEHAETGAHHSYFLVPVGGGEKLVVGSESIQTLTPSSPLGRRLLGKMEGEEIVLERPRGALRATLVSLR